MLYVVNGLVSNVEKIPLFGFLFEVVGLLVTGWFGYRYLVFENDRWGNTTSLTHCKALKLFLHLRLDDVTWCCADSFHSYAFLTSCPAIGRENTVYDLKVLVDWCLLAKLLLCRNELKENFDEFVSKVFGKQNTSVWWANAHTSAFEAVFGALATVAVGSSTGFIRGEMCLGSGQLSKRALCVWCGKALGCCQWVIHSCKQEIQVNCCGLFVGSFAFPWNGSGHFICHAMSTYASELSIVHITPFVAAHTEKHDVDGLHMSVDGKCLFGFNGCWFCYQHVSVLHAIINFGTTRTGSQTIWHWQDLMHAVQAAIQRALPKNNKPGVSAMHLISWKAESQRPPQTFTCQTLTSGCSRGLDFKWVKWYLMSFRIHQMQSLDQLVRYDKHRSILILQSGIDWSP